jgi:hypothetical protein
LDSFEEETPPAKETAEEETATKATAEKITAATEAGRNEKDNIFTPVA